jgi:hypothetical protein
MVIDLDGKRVTVDGTVYQFHTLERATGFFRSLSEGCALEAARQRWKPHIVWGRVAQSTPVEPASSHDAGAA